MIRPKLIYLARRNPALTKEGFVPRWRQHGALGMSMPRWKNIWRYAHCDVVSDSDYDGVGIVWHRSAEARRAHREDQSSQAQMEADEVETFAELVRNFCALYEAHLVFDVGSATPLKLFRFLRRAPHLGEAEFAEQMATVTVDLTMRTDGLRDIIRRYVQNRRLVPERGQWGLDYDVVEEMWFDTIEDARQGLEMIRGNAHLGRFLHNIVAEEVAVLTNEVILYELPE